MTMIALEDALTHAIEGRKVRRKGNKTGNLQRAKRVVKGSPEVMVKITGFGKGMGHITAHLRYVTRNANLALETDRGDVVRDKEGIKDLLLQWAAEIDSTTRHKNQRDTMHLVLSMPEGTPETAVRSAARAYAKRAFSTNHEYVFALHTDEPHPHVHLTVRMRGFDGNRLNPRKADLQAWRQNFAQAMRDEGVEAEATPRSVRGVVLKAESNIVRHIERGGQGRSPRISRVNAARNKEIAEELIAEAKGYIPTEWPWEAPIKQRQQFVRSAWLAAAAAAEQPTTTFKEHLHVRPHYDRLDSARVDIGQRAAAVYQSNVEVPTGRAPTIALARMRDLSCLDVVQHRRPAQVFLHAHAPDRVGRHGGADHALRRSRTRDLAPATAIKGDSKRPERVTSDPAVDASLTAAIRRFVQGMPVIDTQRHVLKQRMASALHRQAEIGQLPEEGTGHTPTIRTQKTYER